PRLPRSTPFPYTTLFRSGSGSHPEGLSVVRGSPAGSAEFPDGAIRSAAPAVARYRPHPRGVGGGYPVVQHVAVRRRGAGAQAFRSEEHTSELQSRENLVC